MLGCLQIWAKHVDVALACEGRGMEEVRSAPELPVVQALLRTIVERMHKTGN